MTTRRRGRPRRTPAQRAEQRERLIEAAMDAVRRKGADSSMDDMARAAGVSKPVLYSEFGDKRGVADAIAVTLAHRLEVRAAADLAGQLDIPSVVRATISALIDLIDTEPELYQFIVRSIRSSDRGLLDNALVRVVQQRLTVLMGLLLPGLDEVRLRALADGLFGFGFAAVESWTSHRELTKEELIEALSTVIQGGIEAAGTLRS
ncbi:MAG TPA: TetR/AcrR family transcriptional regulator [Acidimicrobiales bacterium]|nr:TetR/AcrR family transcriptional regulator [Acidimicrobiales bacterium]